VDRRVDDVDFAAGDAVRRAFADAGFGEPDLFTAEPSPGAHALDG
jgi:galactokinase